MAVCVQLELEQRGSGLRALISGFTVCLNSKVVRDKGLKPRIYTALITANHQRIPPKLSLAKGGDGCSPSALVDGVPIEGAELRTYPDPRDSQTP